MKTKALFITRSSLIAAAYVTLTLVAGAFNLASGAIQVRFSEALCVLPYFTLAAVPGLSVGCLISNIILGANIFDIIFGTLATLLGAVFSYLLRRCKWLVPCAPIIANTAIIPFVIRYAYGVKDALAFLFVTVFIGEVISAGILGIMLLLILEKYARLLFRD